MYGYLAAVNLIAFALYGIDKYKARRRLWRIPEAVLLLAAALGGSAGAYLGMIFFHHKTKKPRFFFGVPAMLVIQLLFLWFFIHKTGGGQTLSCLAKVYEKKYWQLL